MKGIFLKVLTFFIARDSLKTSKADNARLMKSAGMPEVPRGTLRVMSFNIQHCVNYLNREIDTEFFAEAIKEISADIIGLNEVWGKGLNKESQARVLAKKLGYYYCHGRTIFTDGTTEYGNALLSKYPLTSVEKIKIPDPVKKKDGKHYETRGIIKATVDVAGTPFTVIVTHFGLNAEEQVNAVKEVSAAIEEKHCILMGDFNVTPDNEVLGPIYAGLCDTSAAFEEDCLSYPSDEPRVRIDYMFASKDIKVCSAKIPDMVVSDHRPYICEFKY